jgi:hypothetical protein
VSPWKVILITMVIFGCGVVTGGLLMKAGLPHFPIVELAPRTNNVGSQPPAFNQLQQPAFLRRMDKQLDLTPDEHDKIAKIMNDSQERTKPLWKLIAPGLREEMKRVRGEIRAVLNPKQQKDFDDLLKTRPRGSGNLNRLERKLPESTVQTIQTNQP